MKSRTISVDDMCRLIESCYRSEVAEMKFGELHLVFRAKVPAQSTPVTAPEAVIPQEVLQAQQTVSEQARTKSHHDELAERREQLLLEDPYEYEKAVASGELSEASQP